MEASQPLSIESFSYSWLVNLNPSLDGFDECDEASSFIEMDPRMPPSKRFFRNSQDFKFDFPISQAPLTLVHADELFSNGYIMPLFVNSMKMEAYEYEVVSDSGSTTTSLPIATSDSVQTSKPNRMRRCRRLSKRMLLKYLDFIRPLYRRIRGRSKSKSSSRGEGVVDARSIQTKKTKKWVYSAETSPRISVAYSADEWRNSCDSESSIYEAVFHCKKSIGA